MNSPGGYIYVLHGPETFQRDELLRGVKDRMRALPAGEHNMTELVGQESTVVAMRAAADAVPFLADRRLVVVRGLLTRLLGVSTGAPRRKPSARKAPASTSNEYESLLAYLPIVPFTSSIAFVEDVALKKEKLSDIVAQIPKGRRLERQFSREDDVASWVRKRASMVGADLDESAVRELAAMGGDDLRRLDGEIRKLSDYADERPVTRDDVRQLVVAKDVIVWRLLDALAARRADSALSALRQLELQGDSADVLLVRDIAPFYRRLLVAQEIKRLDQRTRATVDVEALGVNPRSLPRLQEQAAAFRAGELDRSLDELLALDRSIKTGATQASAALEVAIVRLCTRLTQAEAA